MHTTAHGLLQQLQVQLQPVSGWGVPSLGGKPAVHTAVQVLQVKHARQAASQWLFLQASSSFPVLNRQTLHPALCWNAVLTANNNSSGRTMYSPLLTSCVQRLSTATAHSSMVADHSCPQSSSRAGACFTGALLPQAAAPAAATAAGPHMSAAYHGNWLHHLLSRSRRCKP